VHLLVAFRQELAEGGFVEGQNVVVEYPSDRGQLRPSARHGRRFGAPLRQRADDGRWRAVGTRGEGRDSTIPIVFGLGSDPVSIGLVESFNRPGGRAITSNRRGRAFRQVSQFTHGRQNVL
jgi:putative ABC transport system substrate-binding protein